MAKKVLRCCEGCGRDTYGVFCSVCLGTNNLFGGGGKLSLKSTTHQSAEDDYGEESGPDSIYQGQHDRSNEPRR